MVTDLTVCLFLAWFLQTRDFVLRSSELATLAAIFHFRYPARFFSFSHVMTRVVTSTVMVLFYSILPVVCVVTTLPTDAY